VTILRVNVLCFTAAAEIPVKIVARASEGIVTEARSTTPNDFVTDPVYNIIARQ